MVDEARTHRKRSAPDDDADTAATPRGARQWRLAARTAIAGGVVFALMALLAPRAATAGLDEAVLRALRSLDDPELPLGGHHVADVARDLTALGSTAVLVLVVGLVAGYLAVDRRGRDAVMVLVASIGGTALDLALKTWFARERPDVVPHLAIAHTASFPSGHSMLAAVVYPTLGALLARFAKRRGTQILPIAAALAITFLVGVSRLVLGVHYPTDVLAGWGAGAAWSGACWLVADRLARTGAVEGRQGA
jgi:undecaprenyl-diphosphatase